MKIFSKRGLQQIPSNYLSEIDFKDFIKLYKDYTKEPCSYLVSDRTLSSDNHQDLGRTYYKNGY